MKTLLDKLSRLPRWEPTDEGEMREAPGGEFVFREDVMEIVESEASAQLSAIPREVGNRDT